MQAKQRLTGSDGGRAIDALEQIRTGVRLILLSAWLFFMPRPSGAKEFVFFIVWCALLCGSFALEPSIMKGLRRSISGRDAGDSASLKPRRPTWLEIVIAVCAAALLAGVVFGAGIHWNRSTAAMGFFLGLLMVFAARLEGQSGLYAPGLLTAVAGALLAIAVKNNELGWFLVCCGGGALYVGWGTVTLATLQHRAGSNSPAALHLQ